MKRIVALALVAVLMVACGATPKIKVNGETAKVGDGLYALFQTTQGDILLKLEMEKAPMTVANFVALAEGNHPETKIKRGEPFFDGLTFHRVIPQFMCQGGDPKGTGEGDPGYSFPDEFHPDLRHYGPGILSMANSGPGTNGSQFFITEVATPWLDDRHSIFGHVILGGEKIAEMARVATNPQNNMPKEPITMNVKIYRVGKEAKKFDAPATFLLKKKEIEEATAQAREEASKVGQGRAAQYTWLASEGFVDSDIYEPLYSKWNQKAHDLGDGLKLLVLAEGEGEGIRAGDEALVHYAGYLSTGRPFDSSVKSVAELFGTYTPQREPYGPFPVVAGPQGRVIEGWKRGLVGLKKGAQVKLIIPPALGYGERGAGDIIPPGSTLVFDIWVEDIKRN